MNILERDLCGATIHCLTYHKLFDTNATDPYRELVTLRENIKHQHITAFKHLFTQLDRLTFPINFISICICGWCIQCQKCLMLGWKYQHRDEIISADSRTCLHIFFFIQHCKFELIVWVLANVWQNWKCNAVLKKNGLRRQPRFILWELFCIVNSLT